MSGMRLSFFPFITQAKRLSSTSSPSDNHTFPSDTSLSFLFFLPHFSSSSSSSISFFFISFLNSDPKGPISCRNFQTSVRPSVCVSVLLSPHWPSGLQISTFRSDLGPQISPPISFSDLQSALQASNQLSRPQISHPSLKSTPKTKSLPSDLKSALHA